MLSQIKKWLRENWNIIVLAVFTALVSWYLTDAMLTSKEMLQSITQAEATVLSLFGIIVAYLLTSYDTRLDRLEQQRYDSEKRDNYPKMYMIDEQKGKIRERKRKTALACLCIGFSLILSLCYCQS
jgi:hypothetical protein